MTGSPGPPPTEFPNAVEGAKERKKIAAEERRAIQDKMELTMKEWEETPGMMFEWRSRMSKLICLMLEEMIMREVGGSRTKENVRMRAIIQFQNISAQMEEHRMETPVVCPHCTKEFNLA